MKTFIHFAPCIILLALSSCGKWEGTVDSRQKIDYIMSKEVMTCDGEPYYSLDWHVSDRWQWDDDELYRIDHYDFNQFSENYFYDNHERISYTTVPALKIRTDFYYDGRKLEKIDCQKDGKQLYYILFQHDDKKLVGMEMYRYPMADNDTLNQKALMSPLSFLLGPDVAALIKSRNNNAKSDIQITKYTFTWTDGNITRIDCPDEGWSSEIEYDKKRNPYSQLFGYSEMNGGMYRFEMLSRNNMLSLHQPDNDYSFSYEYDGDYPSQRTVSYTFYAINNNTWDTSLFTYTRTEKYSYKD